MKKYLKLTLIGLLLHCSGAMAQRSDISLGAAPVFVLDGFGGHAQVNLHNASNGFVQASVLIGLANEKVTSLGLEYPKNNYLLNLGYFTRVLSAPNGALSVFIGGGASMGQESLNNGNPELEDGSLLLAEGGFVYGGFLSLDLDYFLTDSLSISIPLNVYYHPDSDLDKTMFAAGIGLRYYMN